MIGEQSNDSALSRRDFHNEEVDEEHLPEVILETIAFENLPDTRYAQKVEGKEEYLVREKWTWSAIDEKPKRVGFDFETDDWGDSYPWGPANIAQINRPKVHRVDAFSDTSVQATEILSILQEYLVDRLTNPDEGEIAEKLKQDQQKILAQISTIRSTLQAAAKSEIEAVEEELSKLISKVFPNYKVSFKTDTENTNVSFLSALFKKEAVLTMGPEGGFQSPVELQGSGARRTLLWNILHFIAEKELGKSKGKKSKDVVGQSRPHVLLLDEPEICLHPSAIREACKTLYNLPEAGRWQVMVTTHCPIFVDLSRDNTTIVRVDRNPTGTVTGTTIYRPKELQLSADERENIKLLNIYDPYVAEFFFGGRTIIVEGDTEFTAFRFICARYPEEYGDLHVVKARGKATIVPLVKILNRFNATFSVLHDADTPQITLKNGNIRTNPAWTMNSRIKDAIGTAISDGRVRLVASISNFETAYLGDEQKSDKPYHVIEVLAEDEFKRLIVKQLIDSLLDKTIKLPDNACAWTDLQELTSSNISKVVTINEGTASTFGFDNLIVDIAAEVGAVITTE